MCVLFPASAHAYLDPGTGSYLIQVLIAFLLGMLATGKIIWIHIKSFFSSRFTQQYGKKKGE